MATVACTEIEEDQSIPIKIWNTDPRTAILEDILQALNAPSFSDHCSRKHCSLLLALPAELRTAIYASALADNHNDLSLLRTCRQIHMEASHALYQRPLSFPSQASLTSWVDRSHEADLKRVRTLSLRLTDIDMSSLFDEESKRSNPPPTAWSLYQRELESLDRAFRSLSGLRHLSITPPERIHSQLLRAMYLSFLAMLYTRLSSLSQLTIHDDESLLNKVPSLKLLSGRTRVVFDSTTRTRHTASSSSGTSTDVEKTDDDVVMVDGVPIKMEAMDTD